LLSSTLLSNVAKLITPKRKVPNSLSKKDILLATHGTIGQTEFVSASARKQVRAMHIIVRCESDKINPEELLSVMNSVSFQRKLKSITKGSAMPFASNRDIGNLTIPLRPIAKQKAKGAEFIKLFSKYQSAQNKFFPLILLLLFVIPSLFRSIFQQQE